MSSRTPDTPPATSSSVDVATIRSELARLQGAIDDGKGRLAASALTRARKAGYSPEPKEAAELAERALAAAEKTVEENSRAGMDTRAAPAALEEALAFCEVARTLGSRAPVPDAVNDLAFNVSLALKGAPDQRERRRALRRMADLGVRRISDLLVYAATATWDREGDPGKLKLVEELLADCKIALAEVADLPAALYLRGRILAHDEPGFPREFPEARLMIERAIEGWRKQGPRTREQALWENYYLAMAQDRTGDAARAFKTLDDVWRDRPRGVEIFDRLRARVAMETGDWEGGVEALDEGVTTAVEPAKSVLRLHLDAARRAGADPTLRADVIEKLRHRLRD